VLIYNTTGGIAAVDAAFSKKCCPFLIKSGKCKLGETMLQMTICRQATSLQQSAEWGMRAIQGSLPSLKDKLFFSQTIADCKAFLHLIPMLLNFRAGQIELSQIMTTFYPIFHAVNDNVLDNLN
jgi:hypothetical protein